MGGRADGCMGPAGRSSSYSRRGLGGLRGHGWGLSQWEMRKPAFCQAAPSEKPAQLLRSRGNRTRVLLGRLLEACAPPSPTPAHPAPSQAGTSGAGFKQAPRTPTHLACLMAPSRVLKSAPHSSTTQWKWALWRKSHWASQKSLVPNLAEGPATQRRPWRSGEAGGTASWGEHVPPG